MQRISGLVHIASFGAGFQGRQTGQLPRASTTKGLPGKKTVKILFKET